MVITTLHTCETNIVPLGLPDDGDAVLLHLLPSPPSYSPLRLRQLWGAGLTLPRPAMRKNDTQQL